MKYRRFRRQATPAEPYVSPEAALLSPSIFSPSGGPNIFGHVTLYDGKGSDQQQRFAIFEH